MQKHSTPLTLAWLDTTYQPKSDHCLPRNTVYAEYLTWCGGNCMQPLNPASFGKILRKHFPTLTTRRLGTRGQSKYHYYGIAHRDQPHPPLCPFQLSNARSEWGWLHVEGGWEEVTSRGVTSRDQGTPPAHHYHSAQGEEVVEGEKGLSSPLEPQEPLKFPTTPRPEWEEAWEEWL